MDRKPKLEFETLREFIEYLSRFDLDEPVSFEDNDQFKLAFWDVANPGIVKGTDGTIKVLQKLLFEKVV